MNYLILLVVLISVFAISRVFKISRMTDEISGRKEEDLDVDSNNRISFFLLVFVFGLMAMFTWLIVAYGDAMLPEAATAHGSEIDWLMKYNLYLVSIVFVLFNVALFYFAYRYRYKKGVKAYYYSHSNKLEMIWTIVPSLTMAVIIIAGLLIWWDITDEPKDDTIAVQIYAKQFDWTARYAGADLQLGPSSFNFISGTNPLGIITESTYSNQLVEIDATIKSNKEQLSEIISDSAAEELNRKNDLLLKQKVRILSFDKANEAYDYANDDVIVTGEMYLPVDREAIFYINSRDVIHSMYVPHFRMQMNAVPGMTTEFKFTPTITTASMRDKTGDPDFNYVMMCNKICGASHYNMKLEIVIVSQDEYDDWLASQEDFVANQKKLTASVN